MAKSLLFIPDISGYTKFIQTTEIEHSQHVISELLEVLINANTQELKLAEIEGDALFFYKENDVPSQENLLAQIETMFTAFYSHLQRLEKYRICPCNACATAPNLQLKIIAHTGDLSHIEVHGTRKPFGEKVIEAHRLLKNSVESDNYTLISRSLALEIQLSPYYSSKLFRFRQGSDNYDDKDLEYLYALIDREQLSLPPLDEPLKTSFENAPNITSTRTFPIAAERLLEYVSNYTYRPYWVKGVDRFEFNENEVTRVGTKHTCVIDGKDLNFSTVTIDTKDGELVYGEVTSDIPFLDELNQFFIITPISETESELRSEIYWNVNAPLKRIFVNLFVKPTLKKNTEEALDRLHKFTVEKPVEAT
ncbi:DUF2652 domain-containing protein [Flagellimonas meridianipacifica]|uniref:Uncharacterized protein DUF2652 n=1 Tax=Flagellimonas meridianipacifica TaxID=1080225 RepID=A0A2T0MBW5_9FLAO|nr:DUF2652 domain-containing protein [Allomuricauda pacifica]PRX54994.1 uncharacterized protein DUF2652 [Allomuricauda pacifica]